MAVQLWPFRTVSWLFSICGSLALILGTVGLASVIIHAVNQRRREFGVRISVGATPRDLMADVLRSASRLLVPGPRWSVCCWRRAWPDWRRPR